MKKTIRLGSFLLAFLLLVCTLPVTAWAATTVDLNQNYLFRPRDNAFSFGAGETATLTFTPQYTAEYTLNLNGHGDGGGGRNIKASLTNPDGTVRDFVYPNHEGTTTPNFARPFLTAKLEKGKTYIYSVTGKIASTSATVDVNLTSSQSGTLSQTVGLRLYLDQEEFTTYSQQAVLNAMKLLIVDRSGAHIEWKYKDALGSLTVDDVDVIIDLSTCGSCGTNTVVVHYMGYTATANFNLKHDYRPKASVLPTCTTAGYTPYFCTICADEEHRDIVPALGHNYKEKSRAFTQATTSKDGKRTATYACTRTGCKTTYTKTLQTYYKASNIKLNKTAYTYNGKVQKPSVTVKDSKGKALKSTDYRISYPKGMKNVGKYTVKVTLRGNYSGSKSMTYNINPKGTSVSKVTAAKKGFKVTWKKQATQTTGYEVQYSTASNFKKGNKTVTVSKNKTTSKSVSKLSAKKKYYVRVRTYKTVKVNGKNVKLYSGWSVAKSVTTKK